MTETSHNNDPRSSLETYRMTVHLFGGIWIWSSSIANYVLKCTAEDFRNNYDPTVTDVVLMHVDDL